MTPAMTEKTLHERFVAQDGLEYAGFAEYLTGRPLENWRNGFIRRMRATGVREETLRIWYEAYDRHQPDTEDPEEEQRGRSRDAAIAVHEANSYE